MPSRRASLNAAKNRVHLAEEAVGGLRSRESCEGKRYGWSEQQGDGRGRDMGALRHEALGRNPTLLYRPLDATPHFPIGFPAILFPIHYYHLHSSPPSASHLDVPYFVYRR